MNQENLKYLKDNLKYAGFGDGLFSALEAQLKKGEPNFQLTFEKEISGKAFASVLNFRKSDSSDLYFFNSYHATLQRKDGEIRDQAFYLNKGKGITAKEAYNLLDGRAVYKEMEKKNGDKYHAWVQIDFEKRDKANNHDMKQFHELYGYSLVEALGKYPIREMQAPDLKDVLLSSLQRGNLQSVVFEKDGAARAMFVEANPQYKTVNLYDNELKRVPKEDLEKYQVEGKGKEARVEIGNESVNKKEADKTVSNDQGKQQGLAKKGKAKEAKDLLPKKEGVGQKKGVVVK